MTRLEHGLIQVYTGEGKGKTTAATGLAVRAAGRGLAVCFVQFVKGGEPSGELAMLEKIGVEVVRPAEKSSGLMVGEITQEDRDAAAEAWQVASRAIGSGEWDLVVLDELNIALHYGLVDEEKVVEGLVARPEHVEVVCTGRSAPPALVAVADLVTEMRVVKHPFTQGVEARRGIEY